MRDIVLPRRDDAERAVLGGVMVKNAHLFDIAGRLRPEHFAHPHHQAIYRALLSMGKAQRPMDELTVFVELGALRDEIGRGFLGDLVFGVPAGLNVPYYASMVIEASKLRGVIQAAQAVIEAATAAAAEADPVIEQAQAAYFSLRDDAPRQTLWSSEDMTAELFGEMERGGPPKGLGLGIPSVDSMFDGFGAGDWVILGGRPSTGKTALAKQIAIHAAQHVPVLVLSGEMSHRAVWRRSLANVTRIEGWKLAKAKRLTDHEHRIVANGLSQLGGLRLWIDDSPGMTDMHILATARRVQMQHGLGLVVVDYLQLLQPADKGHVRYGTRSEELGAVTRSLKQIARTLEVPVLTLAALSRGAANDRPNMSHIRECGTAEYDADAILLMHRDVQAQKELAPGMASSAELIIEKQRNGPTGAIPLHFFGDIYRFESQAVA